MYLVQNLVYSYRNVLHLPDCLYLVPNLVYSFKYILHLPDCLYLVPNHVYSIWKPTAYMPYTFLNVSIWFQSLSTHLVMSYIFGTVCTLLEMF